jgi:hypothetical protein
MAANIKLKLSSQRYSGFSNEAFTVLAHPTIGWAFLFL